MCQQPQHLQLVRYANSQAPPQTYWIRHSGVGPPSVCFNKVSKGLWSLFKFGNNYFSYMLGPKFHLSFWWGMRTKSMQSWEVIRKILHPNKTLWELRATCRILKYPLWSEFWLLESMQSACLSSNLFLTDFHDPK